MRRLQHLARVLRMEVRVVVAHAFGDFVQDLAQRGGVRGRGIERRKRGEALLEARERVVQEQEGIRVEPTGHAVEIVPA